MAVDRRPPQVFVSYASADQALATRVKEKLRAGNLDAWLAHESLAPGQAWRTAIDVGIGEADAVVAVFTEAAIESRYVTYEWAFALGSGTPVIPVRHRVERSDLHPRLEVLQDADFEEAGDWDRVVHQVRQHAACNRILTYLEHIGPDRTMVSFDGLREHADLGGDDDFLRETVERNPGVLAPARLAGGKPGVRRA